MADGRKEVTATGVVAVRTMSEHVRGKGTRFLSEVLAGQDVRFSPQRDERYRVLAVQDDERLTLDRWYAGPSNACTTMAIGATKDEQARAKQISDEIAALARKLVTERVSVGHFVPNEQMLDIALYATTTVFAVRLAAIELELERMKGRLF